MIHVLCRHFALRIYQKSMCFDICSKVTFYDFYFLSITSYRLLLIVYFKEAYNFLYAGTLSAFIISFNSLHILSCSAKLYLPPHIFAMIFFGSNVSHITLFIIILSCFSINTLYNVSPLYGILVTPSHTSTSSFAFTIFPL